MNRRHGWIDGWMAGWGCPLSWHWKVDIISILHTHIDRSLTSLVVNTPDSGRRGGGGDEEVSSAVGAVVILRRPGQGGMQGTGMRDPLCVCRCGSLLPIVTSPCRNIIHLEANSKRRKPRRPEHPARSQQPGEETLCGLSGGYPPPLLVLLS